MGTDKVSSQPSGVHLFSPPWHLQSDACPPPRAQPWQDAVFFFSKPLQDLPINTDNTAVTWITNCCVSPTSQPWSEPTTSPKSYYPQTTLPRLFLSACISSINCSWIVLSVPWFPLSHCSYTMCMAVHTENKTHTFRSRPRLLSMLSVLVQLSNYLSLSLQWPCCLLSPLWWNDFPTWVRWAWVITSSTKSISESYLFIYLPAKQSYF